MVERPIFIDQQILIRNNPNQFALQRTFKDAGVRRQYFLDGRWQFGTPLEKPSGTRVVFDNVGHFRAVRDVYLAWRRISWMMNGRQKPVYPEEIMRRFLLSRKTGKPLILFTPWGVRENGTPTPENDVLDRIDALRTVLKEQNLPVDVFVMPADTYATEINNVDPDKAGAYFVFLAAECKKRDFQVKPWSEVRGENYEYYRQRSAELTEDKIRELLPQPVIANAVDAAKKRRSSAFSYLSERICEAEIIEKICSPVKISTAAKNKDKGVDRNLPRIYILSNSLQFPWLK